MTDLEYLEAILRSQNLDEDGEELTALRESHEEVVTLLRAKLGKATPSIRPAGSVSKGTLIAKSYDLDVASYVPHDNVEAGETLAEIHETHRKILAERYTVQVKTTALRLHNHGEDFHIDVVPGRFFDSSETDVWLHRTDGDKVRLKTNLDVHVGHIRDSRVVPAIRMIKLWRELNGLDAFKTFVLELAVIKLLAGKKSLKLDEQILHVLIELRDDDNALAVEDPANPTGNDLGPVIEQARPLIKQVAGTSLDALEASGWTAVFGDLPAGEDEKEQVQQRVVDGAAPSRPWWCR
jgi:hypothetical protein